MKSLFQRLAIATLAVGLVACSATPRSEGEVIATTEGTPQPQPVEVKVLAFNDLHGHLVGPAGSVSVGDERLDAGGAQYLGAKVDTIRKAYPNTVVVAAGDMIGASPLLSGLFHDEPTVEALNALGLDMTAVGNHEFDEGLDELRRLAKGGCHPVDGCLDGDGFDGAGFEFLAANVTSDATGETIFPSYMIKEFEDVKVGFIGLTLEATPEIVSPQFVEGLTFEDEVVAINRAVAELKGQGVESIVVLIHEGGYPAADDINGCEGISGPIVEIVDGLDPAVDSIVTGHTHQAYVCEINDILVTSAKSYGRLLTEIDLTIDPVSGDVIESRAANLIVTTEGPTLPTIDALIAKYDVIASPLADQAIGKITGDIVRESGPSGDAPMGRLIADIQLEASKENDAQIAFMNPGGVRNVLLFAPTADEGDGVVTYAEAHAVQPFGNALVTMTFTGQQIHDLLEAQWRADKTRILHVSNGFTYTWNADAEVGDRVDPASIKLNGTPIALDTRYRITVNSFLANGGDGFAIFNEGAERVGGVVDLDAFVDYFKANSPVAPPTKSRITREGAASK